MQNVLVALLSRASCLHNLKSASKETQYLFFYSINNTHAEYFFQDQ